MSNLSALNTVVQTRINELRDEAVQLQKSFNRIRDILNFNDGIRSLEFDIETTFEDGDTITYISKAKLNGIEIFGEVSIYDWNEFIENNAHNPLIHNNISLIGEALISIYHGENISGIILTK